MTAGEDGWQAEFEQVTGEALAYPGRIPADLVQRCLDLSAECDVGDNDLVWYAFGLLLELAGRLWDEQGQEAGELPVIAAMNLALGSYAASADPLMVVALARRLTQHSAGDYSIALYQHAIAMNVPPRSGLRPTARARMLNNLGNLLREHGYLDQAEAALTDCLAETDVTAAGEQELRAVALNNLGQVHSLKGEHALARDMFIESVRVMEAAGEDPAKSAITLDNLAQAEISLGHEAGPLWLADGEYVNLPTSDHYRAAERYLERAQELLAEDLPRTAEDYVISLVNSIDLAAEWKEDARRAEYAGRALEIVQQAPVTDGTRTVVLAANGRLFLDGGQPDEAMRLLRPAFEELVPAMAAHTLPSRFLTALLEAAARTGERELADRTGQVLAAADDEMLARRLTGTAEAQAQSVFREYGERAEQIIGHCLALADGAIAPSWVYDVLLNRKGVLAERQGSAWLRARTSGGRAEELLARVRELRATVARIDLDGAREGAIGAARRAYGEALRELIQAETELNRELGEDAAPPRMSTADVQTCLGAQTLLVDLTTAVGPDGQAGYVAFLVRPAGPVRFRNLGPLAQARERITALQAILAAPPDPDDDPDLRMAALRDAAPRLFGTDDDLPPHVVIAPTGTWGLLPPALFPDAHGGPLIDDHVVDVVPSARWLVARASRAHPDGDCGPPQALGDPDFDRGLPADLPFFPSLRVAPLAYAADEVRAVAAEVGSEPVLGGAVTRELLLALRRPRWLHIATHGVFLDAIGSVAEMREPRSSVSRLVQGAVVTEETDGLWGTADPAATASGPGEAAARTRQRAEWLREIGPRGQLSRSALLLAGFNRWAAGLPTSPETGTGMVSAGEFALLDLAGTELVVLSACETGVGAVSYADGTLLGLRTAALAAGAQCCVCGLWQVDDEQTAALMAMFYQHLNNGRAAGDALRAAQLAIRVRCPDPYYWAGWVAEGAVTPAGG